LTRVGLVIDERNLKASERFSELERTPSVAIVATRLSTFRPAVQLSSPTLKRLSVATEALDG
jgi:hypothetical protein